MPNESSMSEVSERTQIMNQKHHQNVSELLRETQIKVESIRAAKQHFAQELAPDFRVFDFLCTGENGLSRCFAALLDTGMSANRSWGRHGQGSLYLQLFLDALFGQERPSDFWADPAKLRRVELEKVIDGQGRLDIYLEFDQGTIGIENKPWTGDQPGQLARYAEGLKRTSRDQNYMLVFLCNRDPSSESIDEKTILKLQKEGRYVRLSYTEVIDWLKVGLEKTRALTVRLFVDQLAFYIRETINQEPEVNELHEISGVVLESNKNIEAAFQIQQSLSKAKEGLLEKLENDLRRYAKEKNIILDFWLDGMCRGEKYAGFGFRFFDGQHEKISFYFEFNATNLNNLVWGMSGSKENGVSEATQDSLNGVMTEALGLGSRNKWWPWYAYGDQNAFDNYRNWDRNQTPWLDINDGTLVTRITKVVEQVQVAFSDPERQKLLFP